MCLLNWFTNYKLNLFLLEAKWIELVDENIVETIGFTSSDQESCCALPFDKYWFIEGTRLIREHNTVSFSWKRSSKFILPLDAFPLLLELIDNKTINKRFQLIIVGNCKTLEKRLYCSDPQLPQKKECNFLQPPAYYTWKDFKHGICQNITSCEKGCSSEFVLKLMSLKKPIIATNKGITSKIMVHWL